MLDFMNTDFIGSNVHNPWKKEESIQMFLFFLMLGGFAAMWTMERTCRWWNEGFQDSPRLDGPVSVFFWSWCRLN